MTTPRYTDHLGDLIALTTYLALTPKISRTPVWLARDLSLAEQAVRETLNGFPGLFRKSTRTSAEGEHFYTLHARYALRAGEGDDTNQAELRSDLLSTLLQFASQQAAQETAYAQFQVQQAHTLRVTWVAAGAAIVAAVLAGVATVVTAVFAH
jgi:hypothetical protein